MHQYVSSPSGCSDVGAFRRFFLCLPKLQPQPGRAAAQRAAPLLPEREKAVASFCFNRSLRREGRNDQICQAPSGDLTATRRDRKQPQNECQTHLFRVLCSTMGVPCMFPLINNPKSVAEPQKQKAHSACSPKADSPLGSLPDRLWSGSERLRARVRGAGVVVDTTYIGFFCVACSRLSYKQQLNSMITVP